MRGSRRRPRPVRYLYVIIPQIALYVNLFSAIHCHNFDLQYPSARSCRILLDTARDDDGVNFFYIRKNILGLNIPFALNALLMAAVAAVFFFLVLGVQMLFGVLAARIGKSGARFPRTRPNRLMKYLPQRMNGTNSLLRPCLRLSQAI